MTLRAFQPLPQWGHIVIATVRLSRLAGGSGSHPSPLLMYARLYRLEVGVARLCAAENPANWDVAQHYVTRRDTTRRRHVAAVTPDP